MAPRATGGTARGMLRRSLRADADGRALVLAGQVSFLVFLGLAVALHPGFVLKRDEGGISNYGVHMKTAVPYTLAFVLCAVFSFRAALRYRHGEGSARRLGLLLLVYSALLVLTLASTYGYRHDPWLDRAHVVVGVATVAFEVLAAVWMAAQLRGGWDAVFLATQLVGAVLAGLTLVGALHVLFLGQALADVGFALLLVHLAMVTPDGGERPSVRPSAEGPVA